jgi:hypothetical protein
VWKITNQFVTIFNHDWWYFPSNKAKPSTNSTFHGITIDGSGEHANANADDSIRINREVDSNEMDESVCNMKNNMNKEFQHWMESKLIEVMNMKMHLIQFVSIVNLIQMKLMKLIYNMKNITNKECQHTMEFQLI